MNLIAVKNGKSFTIYKKKKKKENKREILILPWRWIIRIMIKRKFTHFPLPNPNHPSGV